VIPLTGCGQTRDPSEQADDLRSFAAEGALLAHDAADGSSLGPFTRVHARVLREDVEKLEPHLERGKLRRLADEIAAARQVGAPRSAVRIRAKDVVPWEEVFRADRRGVVVRGRPD
jgi:hypothetical protein